MAILINLENYDFETKKKRQQQEGGYLACHFYNFAISGKEGGS